MYGGHLRDDMSIPSKNNSASFSKADLGRGTASPAKPGVYWFQSENMARALMVEVREMNEWRVNSVVAHSGYTCRRSDWLLARPDLSIIWTREPVDNHIALIALLNTTRVFTRMHCSGGAVE